MTARQPFQQKFFVCSDFCLIKDCSAYIHGMTEENMSPESGDVQIATTTAQGADCSFRRDHQHRIAKSPLLLARTLRPKLNRFDRRTCLRFDLTDWPTADAAKVRLQLTAAPSGKGFASKSTDTIIAAYGIVDDTLDLWSPDKVSWEELPGVIDDPSQSDIVRLLGRFTIPKERTTIASYTFWSRSDNPLGNPPVGMIAW